MEYRDMYKSTYGTDQIPMPTNAQPFKLLDTYTDVYTPYSLDTLFNDPAAATCIDAIARHAAKMLPQHIRSKNGKMEVLDTKLNMLLSMRPNEYMNTYDFLYKVVAQLYANNNAFIKVRRDDGGNVVGLYPVNGSVEFKEVDSELYVLISHGNGKKACVPYSDIIHLRSHFHDSELLGDQQHRSIKQSLALLDTLKKSLQSAVINSGKLRGVVQFNQTVKPKDLLEKAKAFVTSFMSSNSETGGIAAIDNTASFQQLSTELQKADNSQLEFVRSDVYRYFGISESIVKGDFSDSQWQSFYESILQPLATEMAQEFSTKIFTLQELSHGNRIRFYTENAQYMSTENKIKMVAASIPYGTMSPNEARALYGYSPCPDEKIGDKFLMTLNVVEAGKHAEYQGVGKNPSPSTVQGPGRPSSKGGE